MSLRVPESALRDNVLFNMSRSQSEINRLNSEISSGKRLHSAGDDAVDFAKAKSLRNVLSVTEQYQQNISRADDQLSVTETALSSMQQVLNRAQELAIAMSNGTVNAEQRDSMITEVDHLVEELVSLGNTQLGGRYLFAGYKSDSPPFDATGAYSGDSNIQSIEVGEGVTVGVNLPGDSVLSGATNGIDAFAVLADLKTAMDNNDEAGIGATIAQFASANDQVTQSRMKVGLQLNKLDTRRDHLDEVTFQTRRLLSEREDVDLNAAVSELVVRQNTLELSRSVLGKIIAQGSLFDFIR